jgi:hypothetical protein
MSNVVYFPLPEHHRLRKEVARQEYENAKVARAEAAKLDLFCPDCRARREAAEARYWAAWRMYMDAI